MTPKKGTPHTVYKLTDGTRVPGVTTVIGVLNKPALVPWANKMGLQGIDTNRYVDELADAGTLAHDMILHLHGGPIPELPMYSEYQVELASNSLKSYNSWASLHTIEPLLLEQPLVSEIFSFGGTPDMLCSLDGIATLMDFKTGKALYPEHGTQVAAYRQLLREASFDVDEVQILRIGRTEDEGFEVKPIHRLDMQWELFLHCMEVYRLQKELSRKEGNNDR